MFLDALATLDELLGPLLVDMDPSLDEMDLRAENTFLRLRAAIHANAGLGNMREGFTEELLQEDKRCICIRAARHWSKKARVLIPPHQTKMKKRGT
jgi:hypothetical protein